MKKFIKNSWLGIAGFLFRPVKTFAADSSRQIYAIAPSPNRPPIILVASREELFFGLWPFLLFFAVIVTSIVGIIWYQKNKLTDRWSHFFTSKTFFITSIIVILICILVYWLLVYLPSR